MPAPTLADLLTLAQTCYRRSRETATRLELSTYSEVTESVKLAKAYGARLLSDEPEFEEIDRYSGLRAWGAILAFDLRKSTERAMKVGPRDTFITMHTYMTTMLAVVRGSDGVVVGLRGDGAFAAFGLVHLDDRKKRVTTEEAEEAVRAASLCGAAMVKAIDKVVNPTLKEGGTAAGLAIGVGIDVGEFVATNIGLDRAFELTAYGNCVNKACKRSSIGTQKVVLTNEARRMYPKTKGGTTKFPTFPGHDDAYILQLEDRHNPLK